MHYFWQSKERLTNKYLPISPSVSRREGANSARRSAARPLLTPVHALPLLMVAPVSPELGPLTTGHSLPGHHMATALPFHVPRPACCCCTRTTIPDLVVKTQFGENTHLSWTLHQENTLISRNRKSLGWDLAIARYQPRPFGQQRGFAPTFFFEKIFRKSIFWQYFWHNIFFQNIFTWIL